MNINDLIVQLSEGKDLTKLSYTHGIVTAQQLQKEEFSFMNVDKFEEVLLSFFNNTNAPQEKQAAYMAIQQIAQRSQNLENVAAADVDALIYSIASLYFSLFIKDAAFTNLDIEQFLTGFKSFNATQTFENEDELAEEYYTFKAFFGKDLGKLFLKVNKDRAEVTETPSGLQYEVLKSGDGNVKPTETSNVTVHYHGTLIDGRVFDSSYDRGETISFGLNQVISGWTEGLQLMDNGAKYRFFIPYELAYGENGTQGIPPFSTLIFDVELFSFN